MYKSVRHTCITVYHTGHAAHSANFFALFSSVETKSSLGDRNPNASKLGQLLLSVGDFQGKQGKPIPPAPAPITHTHTHAARQTRSYIWSRLKDGGRMHLTILYAQARSFTTQNIKLNFQES